MTQRTRPLIGITCNRGKDGWDEKFVVNYINALAEMDADAVILSGWQAATLPDGSPYDNGSFAPDERGQIDASILQRLDGLILSGGGDVHPSYFGEAMDGTAEESIDLKRDELELALARAAMGRDMPLFGICRGCQVLNIAAGGRLVQDLPGHRSPKEDPWLHGIDVRSGTKLAHILGETELAVNTYHHQGVNAQKLAPGMVATGTAQPDPWLIEAFESPSLTWTVGLQWHPERLFELPDGHRLIWESFVEACRK